MAIADIAEQIKHTLSTIFHTQGEANVAEVLDISRAEAVFVETDFGDDIYALHLRIPAVRFAKIEDEIDRLENRIQDKLWKLGVRTDGERINIVRIFPELTVGPGAVAVATPTITDENRLWARGRVRLFLSHVSRIKGETAALKSALSPIGVDCFVAHEDIEPTREWHREIEFALRSMHVLCALVTPDFTASKWTDQEVGYALGRAVPVIPVSCGADPYGLLGKHQSLRGDLRQPDDLAGRIIDVIAKEERLRMLLTEGLVDALVESITFANAKASMKRLISMERYLSKGQITRLLVATRDNSQVREAINVPSQITAIAKRAKVALPEPAKATFDDGIPF